MPIYGSDGSGNGHRLLLPNLSGKPLRDQPSPECKAGHAPHNGDQQVLGESCDDGGNDDGPRQIGVGPRQIQGLAVRNQRGRYDDGGRYGRQHVSQSVL